MVIGEDNVRMLINKRVAIFGVGGVGGAVVEGLVRGGIGAIDLFDSDTVSPSNLNRQIIATHETVGMDKVEAFVAPCGVCRQVMAEFADGELEIILAREDGYTVTTLGELLPLRFDKNNLNRE
jgi:molybdopterin/thiamine biosynthesis adenylyltransferase